MPDADKSSDKFFTLDRIFSVVNTFAVTATLVVLTITCWFNYRGVQDSRESVRSLQEQIYQGKYQAVYQQQLNLWSLAAAQRDLAPYIIGGTSQQAPQNAAKASTLDFYAYVYSQLAPVNENGRPVGLALDSSTSVTKPNNVTDTDWSGWKSWSYTIAYGFKTVPALCDNLNKAYDDDFRAAIKNAQSPDAPTPLCRNL